MASLAHSPTNDHRYADLEAIFKELGRNKATGDGTLKTMAFHFMEGGRDGYLSTIKDVDGFDDATRLYTAAAMAYSKKAIDKHTPDGLKANISKGRQFIIAGQNPNVDFCTRAANLCDKHAALAAANVKLRSIYLALLEAARTQNSQDAEITDEQIETCCKKAIPDDPDVVKQLTKARTILDDLRTGKKGVKHTSEVMDEAIQNIDEELAVLALKVKQDAFEVMALELGINVKATSPSADHVTL